MKESFDENFMADLQVEEAKIAQATIASEQEEREVVDDGKQEREDYQAECNYAPAEGF